MKIILFLSLPIFCAFFSHEVVSSFQENNESSVPHSRRKRMNPAPPELDPSHPWAPTIPRYDQSLYDFNIDLPDIVHITRNGQKLGNGFAFHPFLVIARANLFQEMNETNMEEFGVRSQGHANGFTVEHHIRFADINELCDTTLIEVREPILLVRPERLNLEEAGLTLRGINWAENEANRIREERLPNYSPHPHPLQPGAFQREHMTRRYRPI